MKSPVLFDDDFVDPPEYEEDQFILYSDDPATIKKNYKQLISLVHPDKAQDNEVQQRLVDKIQKASDLSDPMENKMYKLGVHKQYKSMQNQPKEESALILKSQMISVNDILEQIKENCIVEELSEFNVQDSWPIVTELTLGADISNGFRWNRVGTALTWQYTLNGNSLYVSPSTHVEFKHPMAIRSAMYKIKDDYPEANFIYANQSYLVHTPSKVAILPLYKLNYSVPLGIKTSYKGIKFNLETSLFNPSLKLVINNQTRFAQIQSFIAYQKNSIQCGISAFRPVNGRVFTVGLTLVSNIETMVLDEEYDDEEEDEEDGAAQTAADGQDVNVDSEIVELETMVSRERASFI